MFLDVVTQYFHGTMIVPWYFSPSTLEFNVNTMGQEFQYHGTKVLPRNAITYHGVATVCFCNLDAHHSQHSTISLLNTLARFKFSATSKIFL